MALPPSQTRTCNGALALLGESKRITSVNDGTPLAKIFLQLWDEAVDELLAAHPWNPTLFRWSIPVSGDFTPDGSEFSQAFEIPSECLRWLPYKKDHPDYFEGVEEGGYILSDADAPLTLRGIRRIDNLAKWTPGMRASLEALLAAKTAKPITGQTGMMDRMWAKFDDRLSAARREDGLATGDRERRAEFRSNWNAARNRPNGGVRFR